MSHRCDAFPIWAWKSNTEFSGPRALDIDHTRYLSSMVLESLLGIYTPIVLYIDGTRSEQNVTTHPTYLS
jgi:hypothetical protein